MTVEGRLSDNFIKGFATFHAFSSEIQRWLKNA